MVGAFLAFETRKVNIKELSDSRIIALSIYSLCIVCVALTPIAYLLDAFVIEQYAIMGALLLASVTFILGLLFIPKVCVCAVGVAVYNGEWVCAVCGWGYVVSVWMGVCSGSGDVQWECTMGSGGGQ